MPAWIDPGQVASLWRPLVYTLGTVTVAWIIGRLLGAAAAARMSSWRSGHPAPWPPAVSDALRTRLPLWALLSGVWLASGFWPITPEGRLFIARVLFAVGAMSVTLAVARIASAMVDVYGTTLAPTLPATSLTRNIASAMVVVTGGLVILNGLGLSITPMLTALGVGGLAVALALQEPLSNFFAGFFISLAGQIRVGDYVTLDSGQQGYVSDFSWRSTRVRMLANNLVVVPNSRLAQAIVVNHHLPTTDLAVLVEVGVDYGSDLAHVEQVVTEVGRAVMREVEGGVPEFQPFVRFHTFGDSSIDFTVILRAQEFTGQYLVKHEFVKRLHARFRTEGIVIPFPIRTLYGPSALPLSTAVTAPPGG